MNTFQYECKVLTTIDGIEREFVLPTDELPEDKGRLPLEGFSHSNFMMNLLFYQDIDVIELNSLLKNINNCNEYVQNTIFALFYSTRNRTFHDLKRAFELRNDYVPVSRIGPCPELQAGELLFRSMCYPDTIDDYVSGRESFFNALFYMGIRSRDIFYFENYIYVKVINHNTIHSLEELKFVNRLLTEGDYYNDEFYLQLD